MTPGTRLGPYEIQSAIGAGGMGEVYRARDTRLDRIVAVKILGHAAPDTEERRRRFEREARIISSLNHPHICTLYDVGTHDGTDYLVMELVEGRTLAMRLAAGPLPMDQALRRAIEIADALSAAHRRGVVHRDLKPANVMLTANGAKLLDFGVAKTVNPAGMPTVAASPALTAEGSLIGTLHYMAPEQIEGRDADARSDVFAFGAVLHEMLTGQQAFPGDSQSQVIVAVLASQPPLVGTLQSGVPPSLDRLVATCLAKNPDDRWQSASDLKRQLEWIAADTGVMSRTGAPLPRRSTGAWRWVAAAVVIVAGAALSAWWLRRPVPVAPETRLEISTLPTTQETSLALSPDGRTVAFVGQQGVASVLWLRALNGVAAKPLAGTAGAVQPFWSPDGQSIGFFAGGKLKRIDLSGGEPLTLADALDPRGGAWGRDGAILFTPSQLSPLSRVAATGGPAVAITTLAPRELGHLYPQILPDGVHLIYFASGADPGVSVCRLDGTSPKRLFAEPSRAVYLAPGFVLFVRDGTLLAQRLDLRQFEPVGGPIRVADRVATTDLSAAISTSEAGDIIYRGVPQDNARQLTWFDRFGKAVKEVGSPDSARGGGPISISPDGHQVAVARQVDGGTDLWLMDLERGGVMSRFTLSGNANSPLWSRDGRRIIFASPRNGHLDFFEKSVDGGPEQPLLVTGQHKTPSDWSPDGHVLFYQNADEKTHLDIWAFPIGGKPFPVVQTPFEDLNAQISPDGAWLAYQSSESERHEVYVRPLRGGAAVAVSTDGGTQPRWRRDGRELFYLRLDGSLTAVPITLKPNGEPPTVGAPVRLFPTRAGGPNIQQRSYEVSSDGQRFLFDVPLQTSTAPLVLIQNWRP